MLELLKAMTAPVYICLETKSLNFILQKPQHNLLHKYIVLKKDKCRSGSQTLRLNPFPILFRMLLILKAFLCI